MKPWPLLLIVGLIGCQPQKQAATTLAVPAIMIIHPEARSLQKVVEQPGRIEGFEQTPLYSKLPGYVKKWSADIGDVVKEGQVLAELFIPEAEEELKQKEASVGLATAQVEEARKAFAAARANIEKTDAGIKQAEASKTRATATLLRWRTELGRQRSLVGGAVAQSELDITTDAFRAAEAALIESEAAIDFSKAAKTAASADADKAEAQVLVAQAQLQLAEADRRRVAALLAYTKITAPFAGVVTRRQIDTGHFVQAPSGTTATSVQPLFNIVRTDPVRIFVDVPEVDAPFVDKGLPAVIRVQSLQEQELSAPVVRVSWALDTLTRTLRAEIDLPNGDGRLRPGMYVTAKITMTRDKAMSIPASGVAVQNEQTYVVVVENGKAKRVKVRLGLRTKGFVELLSKLEPSSDATQPARWIKFTGEESLVGANLAAIEDGQTVQTTK
ncbi:MAG TPA: efflux RND transporter periplasmic adaptor subunit [Gemmatales bacterium]|nr:efflux RND transporter periplasmic adaptor subunit [Gemmatales bacterium]